MEPFAKNLRWIRGARSAFGFSQKQMADALGISESSYQKKEAGDIRFSDGEKVMVAKILGLSMDQVNQIFSEGSYQTETTTAAAERRFRPSCHKLYNEPRIKKWDVEPRKLLKIHGVKPD